MGRAIIGGVITSTLLTLVVVPVAYSYLDDLSGWFARKLHGRRAAASGGSTPTHRPGFMPADKE
jgi:HAE1 family hydrophobic/amphiphilic exporter-1